MTWIRTIAPEAAQTTLKQAYDRVGAKRGEVGNIHVAMSLAPDALMAHLDLYTAVHFSQGPLTRREREIVATVVSRAVECDYCVAHHADALGRHATEPGLQILVATDHTKAPLSPRERLMADHAVKLTKTPSEVGEDDITTLREAGLDDEEILQLTLAASYFNFATRVALGLGVTHDDIARPYKY